MQPSKQCFHLNPVIDTQQIENLPQYAFALQQASVVLKNKQTYITVTKDLNFGQTLKVRIKY